jgi:exopolyphosphatase/guanosine-5'-triphosphate,3'-diphosphate pyrophosphatase
MTASGPAPGTVIAAIDIGSNSIKMTVARLQPDGTIRDIGWRSEVVRLGAGIDQTGRLADDRIEATLDALRRFAHEAHELGAARILAVATEATRAASNGAVFLNRVRDELGIDAVTIDGEREAELSFRGLAATADVSGEVVVADIGGGSTELIYTHDEAMVRSASVALGSGRLTDRFVVADPPRSDELSLCHQRALETLRPPYRGLGVLADTRLRLILVGGTGEYLGRLVPNRDAVTRDDVDAVLIRLQQLPAAALAAELGIPESRARVLPAGVAVVTALIELIAPFAITVGQSGLRAGLLLEAFGSLEPSTAKGAGR